MEIDSVTACGKRGLLRICGDSTSWSSKVFVNWLADARAPLRATCRETPYGSRRSAKENPSIEGFSFYSI